VIAPPQDDTDDTREAYAQRLAALIAP
jgi:hypothetical protein